MRQPREFIEPVLYSLNKKWWQLMNCWTHWTEKLPSLKILLWSYLAKIWERWTSSTKKFALNDQSSSLKVNAFKPRTCVKFGISHGVGPFNYSIVYNAFPVRDFDKNRVICLRESANPFWSLIMKNQMRDLTAWIFWNGLSFGPWSRRLF